MIMGELALAIAAVFTGAALYVNVAEQPARLALDDAARLSEWKVSYQRSFGIQGCVAFAGFVLGTLAWRLSGDWRYALGGGVLIANWPYTVFWVMPTDRQLMSFDPATAGPRSHALIEKWGTLHMVRSALGALSCLIFLWAGT